jgi:hypothetical protein
VHTETLEEKAEFVRYAYGSSDRWRLMLQARDRRVGISTAALVLTRLMLKNGFAHFVFLTKRWSHRDVGLRQAKNAASQ